MKPLAWYITKFDKKSLIVFCLLICFYAYGIYFVVEKYNTPLEFMLKPFLVSLWLFMTVVLCWNIDVKRDGVRAFVGFCGGLVLETCGTITELWSYYTNERPPIWILPAWPVATLAIDRLSRACNYLIPNRDLEKIWWISMCLSVVVIAHFVWPAITNWSIIITFGGAIVFVFFVNDNHRQDLTLLLAGSLLGFFLELWGTTHYSWLYYNHQQPPFAAVVAHGFIAVAFQRAAALVVKLIPALDSHIEQLEFAKEIVYVPQSRKKTEKNRKKKRAWR